MNRTSVALLAALEALLTVGIGIAVALVPMTLLWAVQYGFAVDWLVFWRAAVCSWLLGNGADLAVSLPGDVVASIGITGAATPFFVTIAPLGFGLLTVLMGYRTGRRAARAGHPLTAAAASLFVFGVLSAGTTLSALNGVVRPSIVQGTILPPLMFALGLAVGVVVDGVAAGRTLDVPVLGDRLASHHRAVLGAAIRGGIAAAAAVVGVAAVLLAVVVFANFGVITSLYEAAQPTVIGVTMTTLGQLAFIPNAVIWVASWLVGPGFALGSGTAVSPVGTVLGPVPGIPLLGTVPTGDLAFGFAGLIVPLLAGFLGAMVVRRRLAGAIGSRSLPAWLIAAAAGIGVVAGIVLGVFAWFSAGAAGPGRLVEVGPNPFLVGAFAALEVAVAAAIGMASGGHSRDEPVSVAPVVDESRTTTPL